MKRFRPGLAMAMLAMSPLSLAARGDNSLISISTGGVQGDYYSSSAQFSADNRYCVFESLATNLVDNDTNNTFDVFLRDRVLGTTQMVSVDSFGNQLPDTNGASITGDGRYVVFASTGVDGNYYAEVYIRDLHAGTTRCISVSNSGAIANNSCTPQGISDDARYVVFRSAATNLVAGETDTVADLYIRDLVTLKTVKISSVPSYDEGAGWTSFSADGRIVAYEKSLNFAFIFVYDRVKKMTAAPFKGWSPSVSADGKFVAYQDQRQIWVRDLTTGLAKIASTSANGEPANIDCMYARLSGDGRFVVFNSLASNLVPGAPQRWQSYVKDLLTGYIQLVAQAPGGGLANDQSQDVTISRDGRVIGFDSLATNLVPNDTNGYMDVFAVEFDRGNLLQSLAFNRPVVAGQNRFVGTLELMEAPLTDVTVALSSSTPSLTAGSAAVVSAGTRSRSFAVFCSPVTSPVLATLTAAWGSQTVSASVTLTPLVPSAFQFTPSPVRGGEPVTGRLVLNGVAGVGGKVIFLSDDNSFSETPPSALAPAGAGQVIFSIQTLPVSATQYVAVTASTPEGAKTGHFVIRP